ncbi:MFS transporter [Nakamurella sp. GG22]
MKRLDKAATGAAPTALLVRDRLTVVLYAALGMLGFLLNGIGAILAPLQDQLGVTRAEVAFYPSLFAVALIITGVFGGPFVRRVGHRFGLVAAITGQIAGALLLASSVRVLTLIGAALLGLASALVIQLVPAALGARHPRFTTAVLGEANAVSSFASLLAPAAVAGAIGLGVGWAAGYLLPVLPVAVALLILLLLQRRDWEQTADAVGAQSEPTPGPGLEAGRLLPRWIVLVLAISVEFCLVFWAADAFAEWHGVGPAAAPVLAAMFLLGMAVVRSASSRLTAGRHPLVVILSASGVAMIGFAAFWAFPSAIGAAIGLLIAGGGVALLYPAALARLVAAWPHDRDRAAARGALASGIAIGGAPFLLAALSDAFGLRAAYLIVPGLLMTLAALTVVSMRTRTRPGV